MRQNLNAIRIAACLGVALLAATACSAEVSESNEPSAGGNCPAPNQRFCAAAVGDLLDVTLADLRPTQPSLGYDEVYYRLGRYTFGPDPGGELFGAWCATNGQSLLKSAQPSATLADPDSFACEVPVGSETEESKAAMKTAVIGPGGQVYLTDGHHTLTSFWEAPRGGAGTHIRVKVAGNLSDFQPDAFWKEMKDRGWTWLLDNEGKPVDPQRLPATLGLKQFANDPYRGVLYFVRDVGYAQGDDSPPFQEFYWAQWLRGQSDPSLKPDDVDLHELSPYLTLVGNIAKAIVALPGDTEIANSRTAEELGKLKEFGETDFEALSQPVDGPKPGKLALAIEYKKSR